ncbi:MAG: DUF4198 domain-containing protein [Gammaproteobacteria bacterium]|nr:DUF4198 domain-containing protein [Gammaproteobacteria bacterium]
MMSLDASALMSIKPKPIEPGHEHHRGMGKVFVLNGFENSRVSQITPELNVIELDLDLDQIAFNSLGKDNYHALVAARINKGVEETAIRYVYGRGKPTGRSPRELTDLQKSTLEIVPDPIPREHWHYKAGHEASFIVRYQHQPLASAAVSLFTSHASIANATTDKQGRVTFMLPDDYKVEKAGRRANPPAELLVHVKHQDNDKDYATWLSADYQANPQQWKSTEMGILIAAGGFIFGTVLTGLGRKSSNKKEVNS